MAPSSGANVTFDVGRAISPIYTGGIVALDETGRILVTTLAEDALVTDLHTGELLARIEGVREHENKIVAKKIRMDKV